MFKTYGTDDSGQHITIVHRVAEIVTDPINGQKIIKTKGDGTRERLILTQSLEQIIPSLSKTTLVKWCMSSQSWE